MPTVDLATLGWNAFFEESFVPHRAAGLLPARVATESKHFYTVVSEEGDVLASITGRLHIKKGGKTNLPKVGDWVAINRPAAGEQTLIHAVLPRRTTLSRKLPGREAEEQILGANLDIVFVVQALDATFNLRRLERFLVMVHEGGATPVVLLNKIDLCDDAEKEVAAVQTAIAPTVVIPVCAKTGKGTGKMREYCVKGTTVAFIGTSGVGKSSLINQLYGEELMPTIEVRTQDSKGRHTTSWREMIFLPKGGVVIDTPGMREFHLWGASEGAKETFSEIEALSPGCRFRDCTHTQEKDCAVLAAVAAGTLPRERHDRFVKLQREMSYLREAEKQAGWQHRRKSDRVAHRVFNKQD